MVTFVLDPSPSLLCPICHDVYREPVIAHNCSHSFCVSCLRLALKENNSCPLCRCRLAERDLHPNLALSTLVAELQVYCPYKQYGCPSSVDFDAISIHTRTCPFAPSTCPHHVYGCTFSGTKSEVDRHLKDCVLDKIKFWISGIDDRVHKLEALVELQRREIDSLKNRSARKAFRGRSTSSALSVLDVEGDLDSNSSSNTAGTAVATISLHSFPDGPLTCSMTISDLSHTTGVTSLTHFGGRLFTGSYDGTCRVFDEQGHHLSTLKGHQSSVWGLGCSELHTSSPQNPATRLFSGGSDGTVHVWDLPDFMCFSSPASRTASPTLSESSSSTPILDSNGHVITTACPSSSLQIHSGKVYSVLVPHMPSKTPLLFTSSSDCTICVTNSQTLDSVCVLNGHTDTINSLAYMPETNHLLSCAADQTIKIWDLTTQQCIRTIIDISTEILDIAIGSNMLFASTYDATIGVISLNDYTPITTLCSHSWEVWQLEFVASNGHAKLFSGSFDHTIKRWDPRTMLCDLTLTGHKGFVHALTSSKTGFGGEGALISGCADRTVKIWK